MFRTKPNISASHTFRAADRDEEASLARFAVGQG